MDRKKIVRLATFALARVGMGTGFILATCAILWMLPFLWDRVLLIGGALLAWALCLVNIAFWIQIGDAAAAEFEENEEVSPVAGWTCTLWVGLIPVYWLVGRADLRELYLDAESWTSCVFRMQAGAALGMIATVIAPLVLAVYRVKRKEKRSSRLAAWLVGAAVTFGLFLLHPEAVRVQASEWLGALRNWLGGPGS